MPKPFPFPLNIGTDICSVDRIAKIFRGRLGGRFVERILTPKERLDTRWRWEDALEDEQKWWREMKARNELAMQGWTLEPKKRVAEEDEDEDVVRRRALAVRFLAGRFAAKEAVMKAHLHRRLAWHDIVIKTIPYTGHGGVPGAPVATVLCEDGTMKHGQEAKLSISHDFTPVGSSRHGWATAVCMAFEPRKDAANFGPQRRFTFVPSGRLEERDRVVRTREERPRVEQTDYRSCPRSRFLHGIEDNPLMPGMELALLNQIQRMLSQERRRPSTALLIKHEAAAKGPGHVKSILEEFQSVHDGELNVKVSHMISLGDEFDFTLVTSASREEAYPLLGSVEKINVLRKVRGEKEWTCVWLGTSDWCDMRGNLIFGTARGVMLQSEDPGDSQDV